MTDTVTRASLESLLMDRPLSDRNSCRQVIWRPITPFCPT